MEIKIKTGVPQPDSRDFAQMLSRMYANFGCVVVSNIPDEIILNGRGEFDFENEYGVHRLVRISPFDEQHRRHTCFVDVVIDGKERDGLVCSYLLDPITMARNHITHIETEDVKNVLDGKPLGLKRR